MWGLGLVRLTLYLPPATCNWLGILPCILSRCPFSLSLVTSAHLLPFVCSSLFKLSQHPFLEVRGGEGART